MEVMICEEVSDGMKGISVQIVLCNGMKVMCCEEVSYSMKEICLQIVLG